MAEGTSKSKRTKIEIIAFGTMMRNLRSGCRLSLGQKSEAQAVEFAAGRKVEMINLSILDFVAWSAEII